MTNPTIEEWLREIVEVGERAETIRLILQQHAIAEDLRTARALFALSEAMEAIATDDPE